MYTLELLRIRSLYGLLSVNILFVCFIYLYGQIDVKISQVESVTSEKILIMCLKSEHLQVLQVL